MNLGGKLAEVRSAAGLSRAELSRRLTALGFNAKPYTLQKWETGVSNPSVEAFLAICDICQVADIRQAFAGKRLLRLYDISVSAGAGNYLDGEDSTMIEVDGTVPASADFAVRVGGDSMLPRFVHRQIIFVHAQETLEVGEIGIFFLNHDAYLKKLGSGCLLSLNPDFPPIPVGPMDDFMVFGKVVG